MPTSSFFLRMINCYQSSLRRSELKMCLQRQMIGREKLVWQALVWFYSFLGYRL